MIRVLLLLGLAACRESAVRIADEYPKEVSTLATPPSAGLPYIVGQDLRPAWELGGAPSPRSLTPFRMTDQRGRAISSQDLKGKVTIVSFFFTQCPGICPMTTRNLRAAQTKFWGDGRVLLLSFSVTPETDTPQALEKYARQNHVDYAHWRLVTGKRKDIYALARESFSADTFSARENAELKLKPEDFLHSENVYLLDGEQKLRGIYAGRMPSSIDELIRDTEALVR